MTGPMRASGDKVDPITHEVIIEGLFAIMNEMRSNVMRAAYSSVLAAQGDFSCGLFKPDGGMVAQGPDHPGHVVPLPWGVRAAMEDLGDQLEPGDMIVLNDPYRGGTHLNDVTVLNPVFVDGALFCFPAVRAHWADVGGISPGSYNGEATNIFYEGIRIPPIKIYERGRINRSALTVMMANMRVPGDREGDLMACVGACTIAESRIKSMVERYGKEAFLTVVDRHLDRSEQRMRMQIAGLPEGEFLAEDYMEFFTAGRLDPALISLRLAIAKGEIVADFRESSPQLPGVVNSTAAVTLAAVLIAVKSMVDPGGALNAGTFRPIKCLTSPGTVVDVTFDAPANAHGEVRKRVVSVTLAALAQAAPERVTGDGCGTSFPNVIGGWDVTRARPFVYLAAPAGGNGGFLEADGPNALNNVDLGKLPVLFPTEEQESRFPLRIEELAIRTDSEGAGKSRGGAGVRMRVRLLNPQGAEYSVTCDRAVIPPWGALGGNSGAPILNYVEPAGGEPVAIHTGKIASFGLADGSVVVLQAAGGGGYGDPLDRDPDRVAADIADGYVTAERAQAQYGVALNADGLSVDLARTESLRKSLREARTKLTVTATQVPSYAGTKGRHRIQRLSAVAMSRLGVEEGDLIELIPGAGVALRAWVRLDTSLESDELQLDERAMTILHAAAGDLVEVRVPATLNDANDLIVREGRVKSVSSYPMSSVPLSEATKGEG